MYVVSHTVFSQSIIKPIENLLGESQYNNPNTYYKDTNHKLQNCVGTWLYDNGSDYFLVTFIKTKQKINEHFNVYSDVLTAKFYYRKNGVVIYDNLNQIPTSGSNFKPSDISSGHVKDLHITFYYTEPSSIECHRRRFGMLKVELSNNEQQMIWIRETNENSFHDEPCSNGLEPDDSPFLIPANMTLNRVN